MSDAIRHHLHAIIERFRLTGELDQPDSVVCRADDHPVWWAELQQCWAQAAEMRPADRDLALLRLRLAAMFYVRVVERAERAERDATGPAEVPEPVDLADLRRRVADAHPDRGGDAAEFQRLYEEYRRARGRTG